MVFVKKPFGRGAGQVYIVRSKVIMLISSILTPGTRRQPWVCFVLPVFKQTSHSLPDPLSIRRKFPLKRVPTTPSVRGVSTINVSPSGDSGFLQSANYCKSILCLVSNGLEFDSMQQLAVLGCESTGESVRCSLNTYHLRPVDEACWRFITELREAAVEKPGSMLMGLLKQNGFRNMTRRSIPNNRKNESVA